MALLGLRRMLKKNDARFKSDEQARAMKLALERKQDGLIILPTGGGKSLLFQLLAFMEKNLTTILIVPFVVLVKEMAERCENLGLSYQIWGEEKDFNMSVPQILIMGLEHAVTSRFQQVLVQLESSERLGRIVIDECHIIHSHMDFRPVARRLGSLVRCVSIQVLLLTATLPVELEEKLRIILGCED